MKINVFEPIGICDGVNRALSRVMEIKIANADKNIYLFGPIIHNEKIEDLFKSFNINIVKLKGLNFETRKMIISSYSKDDVVIFQAHGTLDLYKDILDKNGVKYYDLICHVIKANKKLISNSIEKEKREVIFVGKKSHEETISIMDSSSKKLYLYDIKDGFINGQEPKSNDVDIYFQTSLSIEDYNYFSNFFKEKYKNVLIKGDICKKIRERQEKIINDNLTNPGMVIIVGSETSSNTNELYKIASKKYKNATVKIVNNVKEMENFDFKDTKEINVLSGTSALDETINEIVQFLKTK